MLIYPAIDLQDGICVRLALGDFGAATRYGDPFEQLRAFARAGAEWVHIVDLDGAKSGRPVQHELIGRLARETSLRVQCGGGVRERTHIESLLNAGASRVVVGSAAVRRPDDVRRWIDDLGLDQICCAFDVRAKGAGFEVAVEGWAQEGGATLEDALALYPGGSLRHVLATDISRDGVLGGPNLDLLRRILTARPDLCVQASGGVASLEDIAAVRAAGAGGVIIGRALYERRFTLEDALAR